MLILTYRRVGPGESFGEVALLWGNFQRAGTAIVEGVARLAATGGEEPDTCAVLLYISRQDYDNAVGGESQSKWMRNTCSVYVQ